MRNKLACIRNILRGRPTCYRFDVAGKPLVDGLVRESRFYPHMSRQTFQRVPNDSVPVA